MDRKERARQKRAERAAAGLCTICGQPAETRRCEECRARHREYMRQHYAKPEARVKALERMRQYGEANKVRLNAYKRNWNRQNKREVMDAYGGSCVCCGEAHLEFLTIQHSLGDGKDHREELGVDTGAQFYRKLKKLGFPQDRGLQVWCLNCHISVDKYGYCPHQMNQGPSGAPSGAPVLAYDRNQEEG